MDYFARFTEGAKKALSFAAEYAKSMGHNYVGTEHLLLGIIAEGGRAAEILDDYGADEENVKSVVLETVGQGDYVFNSNFGYTPRVKMILELSQSISRQLGNNFVSVEHLLYAIMREPDCLANRILREFGVDFKKMEQEILGLSDQQQTASLEETDTPALDQFGRDLTAAARAGELDPVIGRSSEIERVIQILIRRTKNNPVLIGEPGVGKSAIAEGLALKIYEGNIPELLTGKRVVSLDLAGMVAGAKYRGEFEERFKNALKELTENKSIILFIDEIHTIVGAGASEGSIDAANMLKPMLARGEIQLIGATTIDEYRKYIEKDSALERRFQPVMVGEPTKEETLEILKGLRDKYEAHHKVKITDGALSAAVELSDRYIMDRFLPDKAIDLMDEAASKVRIATFVAPPDIKDAEEKLKTMQKEKEAAVAHQNYEKAAEIRDEERKLKETIAAQKGSWEKEKGSVNLKVTEDDIAEIVSKWTNVPVTKLTENESERLLKLDETLHKRVIGQDEAVSAVARAIRRARAGLKDPKRPIGSFIFLGSTGIGKTELSKALAEAMFDDEDSIIRIDMSEYMESHTVSKLIGSPPGYVGFDDGGQLTDKVRTRPYSVVLFDEIEKAHPDVLNILLQILEDGRLTDSKGRVVSFKNCIVIMTSNIGASSIKEHRRIGFGSSEKDGLPEYDQIKSTVLEELRHAFRPEFLNRIDEIIVFYPLEKADIVKIARLMMNSIAGRLKEQGIELTYTDNAVRKLAEDGYDREYGARPLRRLIQNTVEDKLSEEILSGNVDKNGRIEMHLEGGEIRFR